MSDLLLVGLTLACFALLALGAGVLDRRLTDDRPASSASPASPTERTTTSATSSRDADR